MKLKLALMVGTAWVLGSATLCVADELPLPEVKDVLKRVAEQVEKVDENERLFKESYTYTRSKKTEFKNSKGEVKKLEEKTSNNDPAKRKAKAEVAKPKVEQPSDDGQVTETKSNVKGKAFEKSDFPIGEDLMSRFDFTLVKREVVNGRPALVIDFEPAKKKVPENSIKEKFLNKAAGRVWVDEQNSVPVKADLHLSKPVSVLGGLVGAVHKFKFTFTRMLTPEGIWFTRDTDWHLEGREVFFKRIVDYHEETTNVVRFVTQPPNNAPAAK
ncbi:MAG: hypothetical protein RLY20_1541 [Verrucomicrobiota bacterium]